ncbi:MAG TPA: hypothetical protein VHK86_07460 [Nitrososphaera sp.]|nr:hypothetical protein [Nitrososphaera sp.]HEX2615615.1 hypothetical protein [Nitrososphaera sp.]
MAPSEPTSPCPLPKVKYLTPASFAVFSAICLLMTSHIAFALNSCSVAGTRSFSKNATPGFAPLPMAEPSSTACLT